MKKVLLFVFLSSAFSHLKAQYPLFQFAQSFTTGASVVAATATDPSGNLIVTGTYQGTVDFDTGPGTATLSSIYPIPSFVAKYSPSGAFLWVKGLDNIGIMDVACDNSGNIYFSGYYQGTVDFDPGLGTSNYTSPATTNLPYIEKFDGSGNFAWVNASNSVMSNFGLLNSSIAIDNVNQRVVSTYAAIAGGNGGNVYSGLGNCPHYNAGMSNNAGSGYSGNYGYYSTSTGSCVGGYSGYNSQYDAVNVDVSGNYYLATHLYLNFGTTQSPSYANYANYFSKLNGNNSVWSIVVETLGSASGSFNCKALTFDISGNMVVFGEFQGTYDFDPSTTGHLNIASTSTNTSDLYLAKYNGSTGALIWAKDIGSSTTTKYARDMFVDNNDNILISALFSGTVDVDPSLAVVTRSTTSTTDYDALVARYNTYGAYVWSYQMGSSISNDEVLTMSKLANGDYYTAGCFSGSVDFDPNTSNFIMTGPGGSSASTGFFAKFANCSVAPVTGASSTISGAPAICQGAQITYSISPFIDAGTYIWTLPSGWTGTSSTNTIALTTGTGSGSISVTATNVCGASSAFPSLSITVNPRPVISVISGSMCSGSVFNLSPSGASTYTISGGSATVSPAANASYSVTGTSAQGCAGTNTAISSVTVNITPTISVNSGSICSGNSFVITPSGAGSYTISGGSATVSPLSSSSYSVTGRSVQGCVGANTAVSHVTVNLTPTISVNSGSICPGSAFVIVPSGAGSYVITGGSATVSPAANASYSVTGISAQGCAGSNTAVSHVILSSNPTISVSNGTICSGSSFVIIPTGAITYSYSGGSPTVSPAFTASYTVTGTNAAGCISANGGVVLVTVNALPAVTVSTSSDFICAGNVATLTAGGASQYTWSSGSNATFILVTPTITTNYTVKGEGANGCSKTFVITQYVSACTGIDEKTGASSDISIYPNPGNGLFNVALGTVPENTSVEVYDGMGRILLKQALNKENQEISLDRFANGMYLILITKDQAILKKANIIKQ